VTQIESSLCQARFGAGLLLGGDCRPVLAGVKVVPARARWCGPGRGST